MSVAGADNIKGNDDHNNITFTIKDTKLSVLFVTLSAKDNQKLSKRPSKGFERPVYCNEYKTKSEKKNTANQYRYFLKSNFLEIVCFSFYKPRCQFQKVWCSKILFSKRNHY